MWNEAKKLKRLDKGVDPIDIINIVQRAITCIFIGNAHFVYMRDRRKGLLRRILSDCVNLVVDSLWQKAWLKSRGYLFGKKFRIILTNYGKDIK